MFDTRHIVFPFDFSAQGRKIVPFVRAHALQLRAHVSVVSVVPPPFMHAPPAPRAATDTVVAGLLALAVAMGIGRFAVTPLLPLMLRDGTLSVGTGAEWGQGYREQNA